MTSTCFFDLETTKLWEEIIPQFNSLSYNEREKRRKEVTPQLGLATACILTNESKPQCFSFDGGQERELIDVLDSFDKIIGHNILEFDYPVLSPFIRPNILQKISEKSFDTFKYLKTITNGDFVGLENLATNNLNNKHKTVDTKKIPSMWRNGQKEEVREYCKNDVELLKEIYILGQSEGSLSYNYKVNGVPTLKKIKINW